MDRRKTAFGFILLTVLTAILPFGGNQANGYADTHQQSVGSSLDGTAHESPLLPEYDKLRHGINYAGWVTTNTYTYTFPNGTTFQEGLVYWLTYCFDANAITKDLDAIQKMGVRHIRSFTPVFPMLTFDEANGFTGVNSTALGNFRFFIDEAGRRGMELTPVFFIASGKAWEHPSLLTRFLTFEESSPGSAVPARPVWYKSLITQIGILTANFKDSEVINTWELVNEFSCFVGYLRDPYPNGTGVQTTPSFVLNFFNQTRMEIKKTDTKHYVTISDGWDIITNQSQPWRWYYVPPDYNKTYIEVSDYYSIHQYGDNGTLQEFSHLNKSAIMGEIGCSGDASGGAQLWNHSRYQNVETLRTSWLDTSTKGYSGFTPWEFAENIVRHDRLILGTNEDHHDWGADAYFLMGIYRNDTIDFQNTTNWYFLTEEPQFDGENLISFTIFFRQPMQSPNLYPASQYDESTGGILLEFAADHLMFGNMSLINRFLPASETGAQANPGFVPSSKPIHAFINGTGFVREVPINVAATAQGESMVQAYNGSMVSLTAQVIADTTITIYSDDFTIAANQNYRITIRAVKNGTEQTTTVTPPGDSLKVNLPNGTWSVTVVPDHASPIILYLAVFGCILVAGATTVYYIRKRKR